ncbi:hypothetical protein VNO77_19635 [Canavalia gladiata]|uniref:Uncharacterized protein n=1 Tax=Canavalia gladiata TaxID=3824 RepID=A0AAN9LN29_CANGL
MVKSGSFTLDYPAIYLTKPQFPSVDINLMDMNVVLRSDRIKHVNDDYQYRLKIEALPRSFIKNAGTLHPLSRSHHERRLESSSSSW